MKTSAVIKHYGSIAMTAKELNCDQSAISHWQEEPPPLRQFQIEVLTNHKLKARRKVEKCGRGRKAS